MKPAKMYVTYLVGLQGCWKSGVHNIMVRVCNSLMVSIPANMLSRYLFQVLVWLATIAKARVFSAVFSQLSVLTAYVILPRQWLYKNHTLTVINSAKLLYKMTAEVSIKYNRRKLSASSIASYHFLLVYPLCTEVIPILNLTYTNFN